MNYVQIPDYVFDRIVKTLQRGVDVCCDVDSTSEETEKSPHYANGYSRATMESVITDLTRLKSQSN